jgi:glycosyltransferase involved in cell wall biosynthesis
MSSPLVTFALFGYNQEKFIREAVEGAFSQTYSPLEIILSDDCSADRTFEIMREMADAYRGGHQIRLNKGQSNMGLCAFLDSVVKLATGEWIVIAAGDDISLPTRVAEHMAIAAAHPDAYSSFLAPVPFGDPSEGRVPLVTNKVFRYPESLKASGGGVLGATHAFRTSPWKVFGDLGAGLIAEDWVIPFRSSLLGSVVWSDHPGVRYRVHGNSITAEHWGNAGNSAARSKRIRMELNVLEAFQRDLQTAIKLGVVSPAHGESGLQWLRSALDTNTVILNCVEANGLGDWVPSAIRILSCRNFVGSYGRRLDIVKRTFGTTFRSALFQ